jgi:hypothetical protein
MINHGAISQDASKQINRALQMRKIQRKLHRTA